MKLRACRLKPEQAVDPVKVEVEEVEDVEEVEERPWEQACKVLGCRPYISSSPDLLKASDLPCRTDEEIFTAVARFWWCSRGTSSISRIGVNPILLTLMHVGL